jgi:hypothetical protein
MGGVFGCIIGFYKKIRIIGGKDMGRDWRDLNGDGKIDAVEWMFAEEMMCGSKEEHEALFGDTGDFDDDEDDDF